jgi:hypothetical protein
MKVRPAPIEGARLACARIRPDWRTGRKQALQTEEAFVMIRLRFGSTAKCGWKKVNVIKQLRQQIPQRNLQRSERGVDEKRETLHNLTSLLLTNTTLRQTQQGSTEYGSLTINSR